MLRNYFNEFPPEVQTLLRASGRISEPRDKADAIAQIRDAARRETGPWVRMSGQRTDLVLHDLRLADLDAAVPDKPLLISLSGWWGLINTHALNELKKLYPDPPGLVRMAPEHAAAARGDVEDEGR